MSKEHTDQELLEYFGRGERFFFCMTAGHRRHLQLFEPYGVTPTEYRVMAFLLGYPEGVEPSVAADSLRVLRQSMTKLVDTLEGRGLVTREAHPTDRRRVNLKLLPKGQELVRMLVELDMEYMRHVVTHFAPGEIEEYDRLRLKMDEAQETELKNILEKRKA